MSLSSYYLEYGRHVARLRRRRRRRCRRAYAPASNTASHDDHEKINSWVSFSFLYEYGAPLGGPSGCRSSVNNYGFFGNIVYLRPCSANDTTLAQINNVSSKSNVILLLAAINMSSACQGSITSAACDL